MLIGEGGYLGPSSHLDVSLSFVGDFHDELGLSVDHVLQDRLVDTGRLFRVVMQRCRRSTYTAPKLSELDTKRYSLPSAIN